MDEIEIIPLVGIVINNRQIKLGASESDVRAVLGKPDSTGKHSLYYYENELRFDLDGNGGVEFIEFLGGIDGELQPIVYGDPAFKTDADELFDALKARNSGSIDDSEAEYSYAFLEISVGISREITPYDVQEMMADAQVGKERVSEEDIDEEMFRASHWATIGIGVKDYYKR